MAIKREKRIIVVLAMLFSLMVQLWPATVMPAQALPSTPIMPSGSGTTDDPYRIASPENLLWLSSAINNNSASEPYASYRTACYRQTADLDMSGITTFERIGSSTLGAQSAFRGVYDGGNHTISNLTLTISSAVTDQGFFGYVLGGKIENLILNDYMFDESTALESAGAGGIVAQGKNVTITNCHIIGNSEIVSNSIVINTYIGGIIGYMNGGTVSNCSNSANIRKTQVCNAVLGGIVGTLDDGTVSNCFNIGDIDAVNASVTYYAGGIVGSDYSNIVNCYNVGQINVTGDSSSLIGGVEGTPWGTLSDVYYLKTDVNDPNSAAVTKGKLVRQDTFGNWDFTNTWSIVDTRTHVSYPYLKSMFWIDADSKAPGYAPRPALTAGTVQRASSTDATVTFTSDKAGQYYTAVVAKGAAAPAIDTSGSGTVNDTSENTIMLTGLTAGAKDMYIIDKDVKDIESVKLQIRIPDLAPALTVAVAPGNTTGSTRATITESPTVKFVATLTDAATPTPDVGDAAPASGVNVTGDYISGTEITTGVASGKYLQVYDVDSNGNVVRFYQKQLAAEDISTAPAPLLPSQDLTGIVLSGSPNNFAFVGNIYVYNGVTVANSVYSLTVTPTGAGTITVDGVTVPSGQTSGEIALTAGEAKTIAIVATEAGKSPKTYTIYVTRAPAPPTPPTPPTPSAPANPTGLSATAGNGQVALEWNGVGDATGYRVYEATNAGGYTAPVATVGDAVYGYTATGLLNGTTYYFVVRAGNSAGESGNSNEVSATPFAPASGGGGGQNNSGSGHSSDNAGANQASPTGATPDGTNRDVNVDVNGKAESAGVAVATKEGEKTVITIVVNQQKVEQKLEQEGNKAVVRIPVNASSDVIVGELTGQLMKTMQLKEALVEVKTENATYTLPAQQIDLDAVSSQLGQGVQLPDIKVSIEVAKTTNAMVKVIDSVAEKGKYTIVAPPIDFSVTCAYGDKKVDIHQFNAFVERTIALPDGVDPSKITTGIIVEPDGSVRHVPTKVIVINGRYYAQINSLTNSTYSVIWHPFEFRDTVNHWAKEAVNDMGSRLVIRGVGDDQFAPDSEITRAEFAAIMVNALGLKPGEGDNPHFTDVSDGAWYRDYIQTAAAYRLITGYGNGTFGPLDTITREQAMTLVNRAMNITGLKTTFENGTIDSLLKEFLDVNDSAEYARNGIAACVKTGIITGRESHLLAPKDNITRAEAATIVRKLLQKSNLI
ncbi:S-layer homology domain-containing protein [Heliobacterium chlorum]|uniref:S-layer homology domain-containing protein n=1 Tax=Heliobacterium chlorum TaxID=2698 RepID=A0ABR7T1P3_HELCL|nr:S-layer homology domain-containing protein [Heliobacterium chlorum]MBC9784700.1 S-layer homology domain-containing protein [Heliobacterium chlorum]